MKVIRDDRIIGFDLFHFIELSDEAGRAWNREFEKQGYEALRLQLMRALKLMHERQVAAAREVLDEVSASFTGKVSEDPSLRLVLARWYHGIWAYCHYLDGDLERAEEELARARQAIADALEGHWFLTSLAWHCMDLRVQQARVERVRGAWQEVGRNLEMTRQMIFGEIPFCTLPGGRKIDLEALARHFSELALGDKEKVGISPFFDDDEKRYFIDRNCRQMYSLPGLVVAFP